MIFNEYLNMKILFFSLISVALNVNVNSIRIFTVSSNQVSLPNSLLQNISFLNVTNVIFYCI